MPMRQIGKTLADFCRPDRMALIVYDMQVGIVGQIKDCPEIAAQVAFMGDAILSSVDEVI